MKIINELEEKLMDRKKVVYQGDYNSATPSRAELQLEVAKMQKADPKLVVVENISTAYGTNTVTITAYVYNTAEAYKDLVPKYLAKKSEIKEPEPVKKEEPAAEVKTEAPVEESVKEEAPVVEDKPIEEVKTEVPVAEEKPTEPVVEEAAPVEEPKKEETPVEEKTEDAPAEEVVEEKKE